MGAEAEPPSARAPSKPSLDLAHEDVEDVTADPEAQRRNEAARMIQRNCYAHFLKKRGKGMLALWPSIGQLRGLYMDDAAVNEML